MQLNLFPSQETSTPDEFAGAVQAWLRASGLAGAVRRDSSAEVYGHMWAAFAAWALAEELSLGRLASTDLERYLASRGGHDDLSARYALRFLRLVDRVLGHHARSKRLPANAAATDLLAARPDLRFADAPDARPLPEALLASEAKQLVSYLSAVRPGRGSAGPWQDVRNRASVGLMLGAGLTPGDVRALTLEGVVSEGGRRQGVPWKLRLPGNGNSPARDTPVAAWAGQLLQFWLGVRAEQGIPGAWVFPSTRSSGKPWGKVAQYGAAKDVLRDAGIDSVEGGSFRLRHTFALRQLRKGRSAAEIGRWLGVSDPGVMARYERMLSAPVDVV
jgi:integrase